MLLWAPKDYAEGDSCFVGVPACGDPGAVVSGLRLGYMLSAHSRVPYDLFFSRGFAIRAARSGQPTDSRCHVDLLLLLLRLLRLLHPVVLCLEGA